ncbi:MAG: DUF3991 and toprim domain-containing protein [Oscillospiraceae bacterium]|nr:DUF3991 and toprim domain-containing protein [Oscillospiraceae bacterium]
MSREDYQALVQSARTTDLVQYFQDSGYTLEKRGREYYVKEYPGLCINPDTNQWYHHYTNQGGTNSSIDCLTKVLEKSFNQAVFELTGEDITAKRSDSFPPRQRPRFTSPPPKREPVKKELQMPEQAPNMRRMFAYLCQTRKIPARIVEELVHANLLYQANSTACVEMNGIVKEFHHANAVFIHRDAEGKVVGGELQGLNSFKRFKGVATGTGDSAFHFVPVPAADGKVRRAFLFESAIDLMSFYTFCTNRALLEGTMLVSMAGLKPSFPKKLAAEGVKIISAVDNDNAGRRFENDNGFERSDFVKAMLDDHGFKDWNDLLVYHAAHPKVRLQDIPKIEKPVPVMSMAMSG